MLENISKLLLLNSLGLIALYYYIRSRKSKRVYSNIMEMIGNTPLLYLKSLSKLTNCHIYAKCEFMNPCGSIKDRTTKSIILQAIKKNQLSSNIYEGTSGFQIYILGSTGISLTLMANSLGKSCHIYLPNDMAEEKYRILEICNAQIHKVHPVQITDINHFTKQAQNQALQTNSFFSNQFENLDNFKIHYEETAKEIWDQMDKKIDVFISGSGTGGTIAGISKYLKERNRKVMIILADPPGSALFNKVNNGVLYTDQDKEGFRLKHSFDTVIEGVGLNRLTENFQLAQIDLAYKVSDQETLDMAHFLIQNEGLLLGASSAMNCVAAVKAARQFGPNQRIVTILCDSGNRYLTKFYNQDFLHDKNIKWTKQQKYNNLAFVI